MSNLNQLLATSGCFGVNELTMQDLFTEDKVLREEVRRHFFDIGLGNVTHISVNGFRQSVEFSFQWGELYRPTRAFKVKDIPKTDSDVWRRL